MQIEFPQIKTERLILDQPRESDIVEITSILHNELYAQRTTNIPFPYTTESAKCWINLAKTGFENKDHYIFAIRLEKIIGGIGLRIDKAANKAELGYWLAETYWNKGFATEAAQAIIKFSFETLKLKRIFATHFDFNLASGKVMEKAGMKKEGFLRCHTQKNGTYQNHILYAIINK